MMVLVLFMDSFCLGMFVLLCTIPETSGDKCQHCGGGGVVLFHESLQVGPEIKWSWNPLIFSHS